MLVITVKYRFITRLNRFLLLLFCIWTVLHILVPHTKSENFGVFLKFYFTTQSFLLSFLIWKQRDLSYVEVAYQFLSFYRGQGQAQQHLLFCAKATPWFNTVCPPRGTWAVPPPETKSQKVWSFPHSFCGLKCLFYSYYILNLELFGPRSQVYPGVHKGETAQISMGLLLLHICTGSSTNRTTVGFEFTWLSFILMSQYRVTAISYPPRVWLCFKNPK